eukprot:365353-Chlamydomonas_euryale.AAC.19
MRASDTGMGGCHCASTSSALLISSSGSFAAPARQGKAGHGRHVGTGGMGSRFPVSPKREAVEGASCRWQGQAPGACPFACRRGCQSPGVCSYMCPQGTRAPGHCFRTPSQRISGNPKPKSGHMAVPAHVFIP